MVGLVIDIFLCSSCFTVSVRSACFCLVCFFFFFLPPLGERQAEINLAEGQRQAVIFKAQALAKEIELKADATAYGITTIATAIADGNGRDAVSMRLAEQYLESFGQLAKER